MEKPLSTLFVRRPLLAFFVLSYAFFWLLLLSFFTIAIGLLHLDPADLPAWLVPLLTIIGSWMPSLAAVFVSRMVDGPGAFRRLFGKFLRARFPARWYAAALLPVGLAFAAAGLYRLFGGMASGGGALTPAFWASLLAMNLLTGPTGEEPGWRGFALPRLLQKHSPVKAGLLLGLVWSFWHLPLWLTSGYAGLELLLYILFFNAGIVSLTLLMVWIFRRTGGSLLPMTLLHFTYNASAQLISPQGLGLGPILPLFGWMAGLTLLVMLTVWAAGGFSDLPLKSVRSPG